MAENHTGAKFLPLVSDQLKQDHALSKRIGSPRKRPAWQSNHHIIMNGKTSSPREPNPSAPFFSGLPRDIPFCPNCRNQMTWCYHQMTWSSHGKGYNPSGWMCANFTRCEASSSNTGMWRWHCSQCSFDMCDKCRAQNMHKKLSAVKGYLAASKKVPAAAAAQVSLSLMSLGKRSSTKAEVSPFKKSATSEFAGIAGQEEFTKYSEWCSKKFGGLVGSWRAIDSDGSMLISRTEFFKELAKLGYDGDVDELWNILDRDDSNSLLFQHYAPVAAMRLASFRKWANDDYGSVASLCDAWDQNRNRMPNKKEFRLVCQKHGFKTIKTIDVVFQMYGEYEMYSREPRKLKISNLEALDRWNVPEYFFADADVDGWSRLKTELVGKYDGNALVTWRREFDIDGSMRVNFQEFHKGCKKLEMRTGETFNIAGAWRALDANLSDWVSLREFDLHSYKLLSHFKQSATEHFGSCRKFIESIECQPVSKSAFQTNVFKSGLMKGWSHPASRSATKSPMPSEEFTHGERVQLPGEMRENSENVRLACEYFDPAIEELFHGLDVDDTGKLTHANIKCVDRWDIEQDAAEEKAWQSIAKTQLSIMKSVQ